MKRYDDIERLADLLSAIPNETINNEDAEFIERWRQESPVNEQLYQEINSGEFLDRKIDFVRGNDMHQAYLEFLEMATPIPRKDPAQNGHKNKKRMLYLWSAVAASVLILLMSVSLMLNKAPMVDRPVTEIIPGSAKAILELADGRTFNITESSYSDVIENEFIISGETPGINISTGDRSEVTYNTIYIPRGGEYFLTLDDGTGVYLNAESRLRIPTPFDRSVEVEGEAYFDVAHDPGQPFLVNTRHGEITVLGTSFNVRDYEDEIFQEITLVEGSIKLFRDDSQTGLMPGQQYRLNKQNGETVVKTVDAKRYSHWKDGRFVFDEERLENIMSTMARWYDIEVSYENEALKDIVLTGNLRRYDDFDSVLKMLSMLNKVDITNRGREVLVLVRN